MPSTHWTVTCNQCPITSSSSFSLSTVSCTLLCLSSSTCGPSSWAHLLAIDGAYTHILIRLLDPRFWYDHWPFPREIYQWASSPYPASSIFHCKLWTSKPALSLLAFYCSQTHTLVLHMGWSRWRVISSPQIRTGSSVRSKSLEGQINNMLLIIKYLFS